jgi:hypothetical protein
MNTTASRYSVSLYTTGTPARAFLLAPFGWSFASDNDSRVLAFPTRALARKAARKAWKSPADRVAVIPAPEWLA